MRIFIFWSIYFFVLIMGGLIQKLLFDANLSIGSYIIALGTALFWLIESKKE